MKDMVVKCHIQIYDSINDLPDHQERLLCQKALEARKYAYSKYSKFEVGSSALLDNSEIIVGSNQENAVYPIGMCAERVNIYTARNLYHDSHILKMAISASAIDLHQNIPAFPCGSCRQAILEEELKSGEKIKLFIVAPDHQVYVVGSVKDILPFAFTDSYLI